jgi:hypothetical protein
MGDIKKRIFLACTLSNHVRSGGLGNRCERRAAAKDWTLFRSCSGRQRWLAKWFQLLL